MKQKLERRSFLMRALAIALGLGAYRRGMASFSDESGLKAPGRLPYKIIYNQDNTALFLDTEVPIIPEHVDRMVDEVAEGGGDLFLACCNAQRTNYKSQVWEPYWDEYRKYGTVFGRKRENLIKCAQQMMRLADMGCDYPERVMKRCKERGIASGISVRMDDMHYRGPNSVGKNTVNERLSSFYMNIEMYLPDSERHGGGWAFDYERPEVREHYMALIRELVDRYNPDVLDLDFMRHPPYFDRQDLDRHCETMTGFLSEINTLCNSSGRNIPVMARVPSTPANCLGLGLDVAAWARESLVSGIAMGMKNCTGWEAPVDAFRPLVGKHVSIYAGTERQAGRTALKNIGNIGDQDKASATRWTREMFRGFAAGHLANGADGIYLFNFFVGNSQMMDILADLGSLEGLRKKEKAYRITTYGSTHAEEADLPMQIPVKVPAKQSRRFEMMLASEPEGVKVEALVIFDRQAEPGEVWLQLNDTPLGHASRICDERGDMMYYSWWNIRPGTSAAVFEVPVTAIKDGRNQLVFRNEGITLTVLGMVVRTG
jgi:hypothetical protein